MSVIQKNQFAKELKMQTIKQYEKLINLYNGLLDKHEHINKWFTKTNFQYMKLEEQNYYLKWRVEYLEKWIKKNNPDAKLYKEDNSEYESYKGVKHE